ncbi:unnamed protein product [Phytomonas sp. Hart1]|nr:unnamed protein product [Phytomonas sp. Hart1]|eukprot:CCW71719.1 unnamed protein product [Phytomonas sp. isolate Hart1]
MSSSPPSFPSSFRERFSSTKRLAAIIVYPRECTGIVLKALRGMLFAQRGVRSVVNINLPQGLLEGKTTTTDSSECTGEKMEKVKEARLFLLDPVMFPVSQWQSLPFSSSGEVLPELFSLPLSPEENKAERLTLPRNLLDRLNSAASECDGAQRLYVGTTTYDMTLSYANYTMPEILSTIFSSTPVDSPSSEGTLANSSVAHPAGEKAKEELTALSGFEQVGHIAHVNLSKAHAGFKFIIGQVILDCNPTVTVVVNKLDAISSVYREFAMEVIAVRDNASTNLSPTPSSSMVNSVSESAEELNKLLTATVRQHGCVFRVPYNRVYWNSRLSHEHTRLVNSFHPGEILYDVMAGVGPFAIPAARNGVVVYANDLNPAASEFMKINAKLNHIKEFAKDDEKDSTAGIRIFNMDGREFLKSVVYRSVMPAKDQLSHPDGAHGTCSISPPRRRHVVMNLPALAVEFLDVFSLTNVESPWSQRPKDGTTDSADWNLTIHVYCFSSAPDVLTDAVQQVEHHLGFSLPEENKKSVLMVRDVAPSKRMVCVSFTLPSFFSQSRTATVAPLSLQPNTNAKDVNVVEQEGENLSKIRKLES